MLLKSRKGWNFGYDEAGILATCLVFNSLIFTCLTIFLDISTISTFTDTSLACTHLQMLFHRDLSEHVATWFLHSHRSTLLPFIVVIIFDAEFVLQ